jgi:hypothetical protein
MWSYGPSSNWLLLLTTAIGISIAALTTFWIEIPTKHVACVDNIERVRGEQLKYASCDKGQTISYLSDLTGQGYIVCRCKSSSTPAFENPEIPNVFFSFKVDDVPSNPPKPEHRDEFGL